MAINAKPYTVTWPFGPNTSTEIDQMFDQLFTDLRVSAIGQGGLSALVFPLETKGSIIYISDAIGTVDGLAVSSTAGAFIRSTGTLPEWSITSLPNSATTGDILYASAANAYGNLAAAAAGKVIRATGVGAAPAYSTFTIADTWAVGSLARAAASNELSAFLVGTVGKIIRSDGTVPTYSAWTIPSTFAQGDLIYGSAADTLTALAKSASSTRYLSNTGASNNPAWAQVDLTNGVTGTLPLANGGTAVSDTTQVFTPTRSAEANLDANVTMSEAQYLRVGNTVTMSGRFTADPTAPGATSFEFSLPVASNLGAVEDLAGVAFCGTIAGQGAAILGSVANDTAVVQWIAVDVTSQSWSYTLTYQVI